MSSCVLDSSAVLALMNGETGSAAVLEVLPGACLSTVNYAEIISRLCDWGRSAAQSVADVEALDIDIIPFDAEQAAMAGELRPLTRNLGLSLGDRACLALARSRGLCVLTADNAWAGLDGFEVVIIR